MQEITMFELTGKKALVTGATGGIGAAIARALHGQGAEVALSGTREGVLQEVRDSLGERAHSLVCNLSDPEQVEKLVPAAEEAMGGLDILVNNAGITRDNLALRMKPEDWQAVLDVNLTAAFTLARASIRSMMRQRWGRIINITSVVGVTGNPGQANYAASKAGMIGMSKSLAHELAPRGITVNCIAPGFIETAMTDELNEKQREAILAAVPIRRLGNADEIASGAVFLASGEAAYITGQTLHINGGMAMV
jgi:3-oxoacyl-[acyl-carrier protein] reductase